LFLTSAVVIPAITGVQVSHDILFAANAQLIDVIFVTTTDIPLWWAIAIHNAIPVTRPVRRKADLEGQ
jgi:hypothetical protein